MATALEFNQEVADEICERLASGQSLRAICKDRESGWIPGQNTIFKWLNDNADFAKQYARAREVQAEHYADEIVAIADSPNVTVNPETQEVEARDPARDRLRVEARKWIASKLLPKKYGDKTQIEHTGAVDLRSFLLGAE